MKKYYNSNNRINEHSLDTIKKVELEKRLSSIIEDLFAENYSPESVYYMIQSELNLHFLEYMLEHQKNKES